MDVGNLCVMGGACIIGIAIFYKVWIAENRFDVFTDKYKTYQYDLMIRCGEQEEPVKVTMYSDARYSDPAAFSRVPKGKNGERNPYDPYTGTDLELPCACDQQHYNDGFKTRGGSHMRWIRGVAGILMLSFLSLCMAVADLTVRISDWRKR